MTDYLTREDKMLLERCGYTPYKNEYGFVLTDGLTGIESKMKILGRKFGNRGDFITLDVGDGRFYEIPYDKLPFDAWVFSENELRKTLAPDVPNEIVLIPYSVKITTRSAGGPNLELRDVCNWEKMKEFVECIGEYEVVLRRKK